MNALPRGFFARPVAHRGLHNRTHGVIENSRAACQAAIDHGYAIELDLQLSADGEAMVFHDNALDRLTGETGPISARPATALEEIALTDGGETIPTLADILTLVAGRTPLVIELKDQGGKLDETGVGPLEARTTELLLGYDGPACVMSFNPESMAEMARRAPTLPRGLVAGSADCFGEHIPLKRRNSLAAMQEFEMVQASFASYEAAALPTPRVDALRATGAPVICWTILTPEGAIRAMAHCAQITFEGYLP